MLIHILLHELQHHCNSLSRNITFQINVTLNPYYKTSIKLIILSCPFNFFRQFISLLSFNYLKIITKLTTYLLFSYFLFETFNCHHSLSINVLGFHNIRKCSISNFFYQSIFLENYWKSIFYFAFIFYSFLLNLILKF